MKVSEITATNVASFLRLEGTIDPLLTPILAAAKSYISSYTGIYNQNITDTFTGNGQDSIFQVSKRPFVASTLVIKQNGVTGIVGTDYNFDSVTGQITFITIPAEDDVIVATYTYGLDAFEEFWIVVMILCQDMYDNRILTVDTENMNKVVKTILDLHATNGLPSYEV